MTCVLPLVWKAWEKEEFFRGHELLFIPHVIEGRCCDGPCVLPDTFFLLMVQVFGCLYGVQVARGPTQEQLLKYYSLWEGLVLEKLMKDCNTWDEPVLAQGESERRKERQKQSVDGLTTTPIPCSPAPLRDMEAGREIGESLERFSLEKGYKGKMILVGIVSHYPTLIIIDNKSNASS